MLRVLLLLALGAGCGRLGFEPVGLTGPGSVDGQPGSDGSGSPIADTGFVGTSAQYVKASNTASGDQFGQRVAISADGSTLAIGAPYEDSSATGVGGNQGDNASPSSGAVYVFTLVGGAWVQQAYLKASNTGAGDEFGIAVALSANGDTIAVGAFAETSNATGINGNQADNSAISAGAVYVFERSAGMWSQQAYLKASNTDAGDEFGYVVALSNDGNTLGVSAYLERSAATGINGNQADNSATNAGAVYVFIRTNGSWSQQAYLKASNAEAFDGFGVAMAMSGDGDTLVAGAYAEDSSATGVNGSQTNSPTTSASGAAYVFVRAGTMWTQDAYLKASNTGPNDNFGIDLAIARNGSTIAVAARDEGSGAGGIDGNQADNGTANAGAVYVFARTAGTWAQQAYVKAPSPAAQDEFGQTVALSGHGDTLVIGAWMEDGAATGLNGDPSVKTKANSGAAYVLRRTGTSWGHTHYVKASNSDSEDRFGYSLAITDDGANVVVGAYGEASAATGLGGDQTSNAAGAAGAVYSLR